MMLMIKIILIKLYLYTQNTASALKGPDDAHFQVHICIVCFYCDMALAFAHLFKIYDHTCSMCT